MAGRRVCRTPSAADPAVFGAGPRRPRDGHARLAYDADGPARRYVPFVEVAGRIVPSLPVAAVLAARTIAPDQVTASRMALMLGPTRVPWVEQVVPDYYGPPHPVWRGLVPFRGPTMRANRTPTFPSYSFQDVFLAEQQLLAGQPPHLDPAVFKDRIVVVGVTAEASRTSSRPRTARARCPAPSSTPT